MKTLRRIVSLLAATALLLSCGGGSGGGAPQVLAVYTSFGSVQCSGGGTTLGALQGELVSLGIQVFAARCGLDGVPRVAVCGEPDGRIAMFDIDEAQAVIVLALGFALLSTLPNASATACP